MPDPRPSLLIADDDPVVRAVLGAQLEAAFRLVGTATDATEAIELATAQRPDAALIDVNMPGGGARTAVPAIAEASPRTCLVILSAGEREDAVAGLLACGASAYVEKGASGAGIARALTDALAEYLECSRRPDSRMSIRAEGPPSTDPTANASPLESP